MFQGILLIMVFGTACYLVVQRREQRRKKQEFLDLVLEAAETGDKSRLAAWWRERYPGYKWWCFGPSFQIVLPDDGKDECSL